MRCGNLDAVEEGGGSSSVEFSHGERVDDGREGALDGVAILKSGMGLLAGASGGS